MKNLQPGILLSTAVILLLNGCKFFGNPLPETARIEITSQQVEEVELVVSLNFLAQRRGVTEEGIVVSDTTEVLLLTSDTLRANLPFDEKYNIGDRHRFYAELMLDEEDFDKDLSMKGWIDGEERFFSTLDNHNEGKIRFIFYFRQGQEVVIRPQP